MKRIFAIIMTICLMASVLSVPVFAAEETLPEPDKGTLLRVTAIKGKDTVLVGDYDNFENGWNYAMKIAGDEDEMQEKGYDRVVVDFYKDWTAVNGEFTDEFINGDGFDYNTICIPEEARVTINLNDHKIDRDCSASYFNGEVICISDDADVIINGGANGGTITGGFTDASAGGIYIKDDAKVTLNNVHVKDNVSKWDGGGITVSDGSILTMNGGSLTDNTVRTGALKAYGGAAYVEDATAIFNGVEFKNNSAPADLNYGAAIYANNSEIVINECLFDGNGIKKKEMNSTESVIHGVSSTLTVTASTFINNGGRDADLSAVFKLDESELVMDTSNFSNNSSYFIIVDEDESLVCVSNTKFLDNAAAVLYGDGDTSSDSFFDKCTFNNNIDPDGYESFYDIETTLTFYNCSMGNSTFSDKTFIRFFSDVIGSDVSLGVSALKKDGTTVKIADYASFETGWNDAIDLAKNKTWLQNNDVDRIVVDLFTDWTAVGDDFGSGVGFDWSTIFIPGDTKITLNMNGHTIDRDLKTDDYDGEVIHVDEKADLIINGGKSGDPIIMPGQPAGDVKMGTITGGWSCNGAGGIFIDNYAKVELNNVNVIGNKVTYDDGAGIGVYAGATLVMNGGSVSDNVVKVGFSIGGLFYGGGVFAERATVTLNGVTIANNINVRLVSCLKGSAVGSKDSMVTLKNCLIKDNGLITEYVDEESDTDPDTPVEKTDSTDSIVFAWGGTMVIENTDFIGNGTKDAWAQSEAKHITALINVDNAELTMTGGKVTDNNQVFLFHISHGAANVKGVDCTGNESLAMFRKGKYASKPTSTFTDCKFSAGIPYTPYEEEEDYQFVYDFMFGDENANITFVDCDFGDATFDNKSAATIENTANGVGSLFGEGSLTNILVIISLVISVAAICLAIASHKKKAVLATANEAEESE